MRRILIVIFMLAVFGIALAFVLENLGTVKLNYLFGTVYFPLAAVLVIAIAFGAVIGAFAASPAVFANRRRLRKVEKQLREAQQEIGNLRRAPLRDAP